MRVKKTLLQTLASQLSCNSCSRLTRAWELRKLSYKLSLLNSHATLVRVWPGHQSWENSHTNSRFSTLRQLLFAFDQDIRVEKTLRQTLACQLSSTLMQLFFSFEQDMRIEKTLTQTFVSHLSSTLVVVWPWRTWELRKLSYKLSLINFPQLSCNFCSRLTMQDIRIKKTLIQTFKRLSTPLNPHVN